MTSADLDAGFSLAGTTARPSRPSPDDFNDNDVIYVSGAVNRDGGSVEFLEASIVGPGIRLTDSSASSLTRILRLLSLRRTMPRLGRRQYTDLSSGSW